MTDFAPVEGTPPDDGGKLSSRGVDAARFVFDRLRFFGVAASSFLGFALGAFFGVAESSRGAGFGTPVGRMASGANVWPTAVKPMASAQKPKAQSRARIMGAKLATTF